MYDHGLGDEVIWSYAASAAEVRPKLYRASTLVSADIRLPAGCGTE